jgi:hypothetical protein
MLRPRPELLEQKFAGSFALRTPTFGDSEGGLVSFQRCTRSRQASSRSGTSGTEKRRCEKMLSKIELCTLSQTMQQSDVSCDT